MAVDLDKLILTMIGLCVTLALQAVVQLIVAMRKNGTHGAKELVEAIAEMQSRGQEQMHAAYPPDKFNRMHERIIQVHEVVVTGDRKGAVPQRPQFDGGSR